MKSTELELAAPSAIDRPPQSLSLEDAFAAVTSGKIKPEHVQVMKELLAMDAQRRFNAAFVELQQQLPAIQGMRGVPDKQGNIKFVYANFDDIDAVIRPICLSHGFSYSFREEGIKDGRVTMIMDLQHSAGHSRQIPYSVRIGSGPPGASDSQADVSGHTYAKRGCLESGLSLRIIGDRQDARMEGDPAKKVTKEQAFELERRVGETNSNKVAFLKFCGSDTFANIPATKYDEADAMLRRKEKAGR